MPIFTQNALALWVMDDGPTSVRHRLRAAAIGASPEGTVTIRAGLAADLADALHAASLSEKRHDNEARAARQNLKLEKLAEAEQRGWRWMFWVVGFATGSGVNDLLLMAWRWLQ